MSKMITVLIALLLIIITANKSNAVDVGLNYEFTNIYNLENKKLEAIKMLQKETSKGLEDYSKHYILGILYTPEHVIEAKEEFLKVIKVRPSHVLSYLNLGYLTLNTNTEESIKYFKKALNYNPKLAESYNALAIAYMIQNNKHEAIKVLEQGITSVGNDESLYFNQSLILSSAFIDSEESLRIDRNMTRALTINPKEEYYTVLGFYYLKKNENAAAIRLFNKANEKYSKNIYFRLGLATAYKNLDEYEHAISIAKKSLEISPDNKLILDEIKEYEEAYKAFTNKAMKEKSKP